MVKKIIFTSALFLFSINSFSSTSITSKDQLLTEADFLEYKDLNHKVKIQSVRAGNHDESGTNDYFFTLMLKGIDSVSKEKKEQTISLDSVEIGMR